VNGIGIGKGIAVLFHDLRHWSHYALLILHAICNEFLFIGYRQLRIGWRSL